MLARLLNISFFFPSFFFFSFSSVFPFENRLEGERRRVVHRLQLFVEVGVPSGKFVHTRVFQVLATAVPRFLSSAQGVLWCREASAAVVADSGSR